MIPFSKLCDFGMSIFLCLLLGILRIVLSHFRTTIAREIIRSDCRANPCNAAPPATFQGFPRGMGRGVGTRNFVVLLGTSSAVAHFVREVERDFRGVAPGSCDGVVAVAHTEGMVGANNRGLLLRCYAGFAVHPNVGGCVVVDDFENEFAADIRQALASRPGADNLDVCFISVGRDVAADSAAVHSLVRETVQTAAASERSPQSVSALVLAQQCGGSDAFSGVSGNPASGGCARHLIGNGGRVVLAETDELIGAEKYILSRTKDRDVEEKFLRFVDRYKKYAERHGHTAEGNPSGGNKFRGLYNIALKSLGAAMKKPADVRLEGCAEYGEAIPEEAGYYFMDSPGNDPESIAGQVASGCNIIHFITGNGSVTNFPFVPTVKILTTTARWELLHADMDFNAGRFQDGTSMEVLGQELYELTVATSAGQLCAGERAGHWQVCLWRDWQLSGEVEEPFKDFQQEELPLRGNKPSSDRRWKAVSVRDAPASCRVAVILPTSLCSGQVAVQIAEQINQSMDKQQRDRVVALPHTEGCGTSTSALQDELFANVLLGHVLHPCVARAVFLEHGCEKTHNDWFRHRIADAGVDPAQFSYVSIQADGGIASAAKMVKDVLTADRLPTVEPQTTDMAHLRLAFAATSSVPPSHGRAIAAVAAELIGAGGGLTVAACSPLLRRPDFLDEVVEGGSAALRPNWPFGRHRKHAGVCVMQTPPRLSWVEEITGLTATGVHVLVVLTHRTVPASPMIPSATILCSDSDELDFNDAAHEALVAFYWSEILKAAASGNFSQQVDFAIPRGPTGISL
mmetsp:Transcript_25154/g.57160  ORF Transcript_25154/g.57160 Transcript_25154/m.57160 type:complete len:799 (+) Transcript_25154:337-2733(+)